MFTTIDFYGETRLEETKFQWSNLDTAIKVSLNNFQQVPDSYHNKTKVYRVCDQKFVAVVNKDLTITLNPI